MIQYEGGKIIQEGNYENLISQKGLFRRLAKGYVENEIQ